MAKTTTNPFTQTIQTALATLVNGTGAYAATGGLLAPANLVLFATAGAEGSVMKSITITSDSSSSSTIGFFLSLDGGTTKYLLGTVVVAALSGAATLVNVDFLGNTLMVGLPIDQSGRPVLPLQAAARIYVGIMTTAVVAGRSIWITGIQEDY